MDKEQYLSKLRFELAQNRIVDADEIVKEFEQHFDGKLAAGFSQEEIVRKLDDPALLAAQFGADANRKAALVSRAFMRIWLAVTDLLAALFFILLWGWEAVMTAFSASTAAIAVCLIGGFNLGRLIPPMPYWCGAVIGVAFAALSVLSAGGCVYCFAFLRQLARVYLRFHNNILLHGLGGAMLPSLSLRPQLSTQFRRRLQSVVLFSLAAFATSFIGGLIVSMLSAGAFEFWHVWHWFQ